MEKTLYIHIGTHKTATTSLQRFLAENRSRFEEHGYCYPEMPFIYRHKSPDRNAVFLATNYVDENDVRHPEIEDKNFKEGMHIIHTLFQNHSSVVLSDERLWLTLRKKGFTPMRRLMDDSVQHGYRIVLIVYFRRQDELIESWYSQRVKNSAYRSYHFQGAIDEYKYLDYNYILSGYADIIGKENIIVRRFRDVVKGEGIISDFMTNIGLKLTEEYMLPEQEYNPGLYGNVIEIKRIINELGYFENDDHRMIREALEASSVTSRKLFPCGQFSDAEREAFMKQFEEGNDLIADTFIGDGRPLFSKDYSGPPKQDSNDPHFIDDVIRSSAAIDIRLLRRMKDDEARIKKLEREILNQRKQLDQQRKQIENLRNPLRAFFRKLFRFFRSGSKQATK